MRTLRNSFKSYAAYYAGFCIVAVFLFMAACEKESTPFLSDDFTDGTLKSLEMFDGTYTLTGSTHFPSYAIKEHMVISPWELNMLECNATLTIDGHDFTMITEESMMGMVFRTISWNGTISSGGALKFSWPAEWWDFEGGDRTLEDLAPTFLLHTGCIQYGPDKGTLDYRGKFDGNTFYAATHFMAKQVQSGVIPFYSTGEGGLLTELIEGPIQFEFSIEMNVVE